MNDNKFHYNKEMHQWERVDREQEYKGHIIKTVTYHEDYLLDRPNNHREYHITYPSGRTSSYPINKRGNNIKSLKEWIDFNIKYNREQYL